MKVYLASITHKNGINLLAGGSKEELLWKLAGYCKAQPLTDWCGETVPSQEELLAMSDDQVVETYFTGHPSEFVDEESDHIKHPISNSNPEIDMSEVRPTAQPISKRGSRLSPAAFFAECAKTLEVVKGRSRGF